MPKLLNYFDDALAAADNVADVARIHSRKSKNLVGQLSMFDNALGNDKYSLAGFSHNKPVYQSNLAKLYDFLAPDAATQTDEYMSYLNGLSDSQIQDLIPQNSVSVLNDQMGQNALQTLYNNPDTRMLAEILKKHVR